MKKILVIGSIMMDYVLNVEKFPKVGENIFSKNFERHCGGKGANAATAVSKLGGDVSLYAMLGRDDDGKILEENLAKNGIKFCTEKRSNLTTGKAFIVVDSSGDNFIIVDPGANMDITEDDIENDLKKLISEADIVLIQLEVSVEAIHGIVKICSEFNKKLVIDAGPVRGILAHELRGTYLVSPNETELEALVRKSLNNDEEILEAAKSLLSYDIEHVIIKLGSKGSLYINSDIVKSFPAHSVKAVDSTAAGDSFMAGLCVSLAKGMSMFEAIEYGTKCGAVCVTRHGATSSLPSALDIDNFSQFLI